MNFTAFLHDTTDIIPLTRAHKLYGSAPAGYERTITLQRGSLKYICGSMIDGSNNFSSIGLAADLVGDNNLVTIALDDNHANSALILDYVQIGT